MLAKCWRRQRKQDQHVGQMLAPFAPALKSMNYSSMYMDKLIYLSAILYKSIYAYVNVIWGQKYVYTFRISLLMVLISS